MPTTYDSDADEKYANLSSAEEQPELGSSEWKKGNALAGRGSEESKLVGGPDTDYNGKHYSSSTNRWRAARDNEDGAGRADSPKDLANKESAAADTVGSGYTPGKSKAKGNEKDFFTKLRGSSNARKRIMVAGAAAGGGIIGTVLIFLAMLPLKIDHIIQNVEARLGAATSNALDTEMENSLDDYMTQKVEPSLKYHKNGCNGSTIDARCRASLSDSTNPMGRMYNSWREGKLENKLATKYDLAVGYKNGQFFLNKHGSTIDLGAGGSIFNNPHTKQATRAEIRQAFRSAMSDATFYDKMFMRFKIGKFLESKYGIKRCIIVCKITDPIRDNINNRKVAAKGYLIQRVITPLSESSGIILQCLIGGGDVCNNTTPESNSSDVDGSGDQERLSGFQQNLQSQLDSIAERYGQETLDKILSDANVLSERGFSGYIVTKIGEKLGISAATDKALDAVPIVGQINFAASTVGKLDGIGPKLQALNYAKNSAAAVQEFTMFQTVAAEARSGHTDMAELGSFIKLLGNTEKDINGHTADAASSPAFAKYIRGVNTGGGSSKYMCNDNKPLGAGKLVCDEEKLNGGNAVADAITNVENNIPGWGILRGVADAWNGTIGDLYNTVGKYVSNVTNWLVSHLPGLDWLTQQFSNILQPIIKAITDYLLPSPFSDTMSGARNVDMIIAGGDVAFNKVCAVQLGCGVASVAAMNKVVNDQLAIDKAQFQSQSLFARIFSTDTPYSLVSNLAMDMPTDMLSATNSGVASLVSNPLGRLGGIFSGIVSGPHAFAADLASDPFNVTGNAYTSVPAHPEQYFKENCINGPMATYDASAQTLDVSKWLANDPAFEQNGEPNTRINPSTGEVENVKNNPCLLIQATWQTGGGLFDPSLMPKGSANSAGTAPVSTGSYKDPLRDIKHLTPERIDGGVDYNGDDGPIYAVGNGKVTIVRTSNSGWPGLGTNLSGAYITYQLTDGPASGKFIYMAEDCSPTVKEGDTVTADTKICDYHYQGTAMEMGWTDGKYNYLTNDYITHGEGSYASNSGLDFSKFMVSLHSKAGIIEGTKSTQPMPPGWPTW